MLREELKRGGAKAAKGRGGGKWGDAEMLRGRGLKRQDAKVAKGRGGVDAENREWTRMDTNKSLIIKGFWKMIHSSTE